MTSRPGDAPYTLKHLEEMLGLPRSVVSGLVSAGFVVPARGPRNELRFTFQDVVLLRTAFHLRAARIPPRRLLRSLKQLRERLPAELPLSGLRIKAIGNDVAVKEGDAQWDAASGQLLMDFEVTAQQGSVAFLPREPKASGTAAAGSADDWFHRGEQLEASDAAAAEAAYRQALAAAPGHVYAAVNLGAMLCEAGRCGEAVHVFDSTLERQPAEPLLHFNAAIALEDLHREAEALAHYARCLALDPEFADAHYNAAKLHERLGDRQSALRHLSAYRRLQLAIHS